MHIVIRESLKKSHQHLANEANVCGKYQPCSQATFPLFAKPGN